MISLGILIGEYVFWYGMMNKMSKTMTWEEYSDELKVRLDDKTAELAKVKQQLAIAEKKYARALWWLNEIVNNHRFTPISTAEKAIKELEKWKNI